MSRGTLIPIKLPPGVVRDLTDYTAEGRYVDCNRVRFRDDLPEKIGGWAVNTDYRATGIPRSIMLWRALSEENIIAVGTASHVYVIYQGAIFNITPLRKDTDPASANPIDTTSGSTTVTITDTAHGANPGDYITISGATATGGITIDGEYVVVSSLTANTFTITHTSAATSTATGGGAAVQIEYQLTTGTDGVADGLGWGAGNYGDSTWSTPRDEADGTATEITYWSFALWGEDLVMTKRNGGTYVWDTSAGTATRAAPIANAPATAKFSDVNQDIRILVWYGAFDATASDDDPMLVRWSDQDDYTTVTASITGEAGQFRLTSGTKIVAKIQSRNQTLIFTDTSLYAQQYTAQPFIFNHRLLAEDTTIIGQKAVGEVNGTVFWMGQHNFYTYSGQVNILPCTLRRYVFDAINRDQMQKCYIGINKQYQEVWFFYPRGTNEECSHYVAYYYGEPQKNIWHDGELARTVWKDSDKFLDNPIAFDEAGCFYTHEFGSDDNGAAMTAYVESGAIELDDPVVGAGGALLLCDKYLPDATATGNMKITFYTKKYPQSTEEVTKGPFTIGPTTPKLSFRAKGRQFRLRHESDEVGVSWHIGTPRIRAKASGRR